MKHKIFITSLMAAASVTPGLAQELSGSLTVEGTYSPVIRNHDRLSGQPIRIVPTLSQPALPVALEGVPTQVTPGFGLFMVNDPDIRLAKGADGYVSLMSGSWLNSSLSAGYRFVSTPDTQLGAWLQHNSSSLWRPKPAEPTTGDCDRKKNYDTTVGIYAAHRIDAHNSLSGRLAYHSGYFNYYTDALDATTGLPFAAPTQTLNDVEVNAGWQHSSAADRGLYAGADVTYRYFGYRSAPVMEGTAVKPLRENDIRPHASVGYRFDKTMTAGLDADAHILLYANRSDGAALPVAWRKLLAGDGCTDDYGIVGLTPRFTYATGQWSMRAGARVDLSWGTAGSFNAVHVAPDVAVEYASAPFRISLSATGGVTPNTLAQGAETDYYQLPTLADNTPMYTPVNAMLRIGLCDLRGFSAGIRAGYAVSDNTPVQGWYPFLLFDPSAIPAGSLITPTLSLKGFTLGAEMAYRYSSVLEIKGDVSYQRQHGKDGYYNGADRPRWIADIEACVSPIKDLKIGAGYEYRGVRKLWMLTDAPTTRADHNFTDEQQSRGIRLSDYTGLNAFASYTLDRRYTFRAEVRNILGSDSGLNPLMPTDGLNILGGVSILF